MIQRRPLPPSKSHLSIPPWFSLAKHAGPIPPPMPVHSWYPLLSPPLQIRLVSRLPTIFGNSEPSLAPRLQRDPTNDWLAAPDSVQIGNPAPEDSLCLTLPLLVLGNLGRGGGRSWRPPDDHIYFCQAMTKMGSMFLYDQIHFDLKRVMCFSKDNYLLYP